LCGQWSRADRCECGYDFAKAAALERVLARPPTRKRIAWGVYLATTLLVASYALIPAGAVGELLGAFLGVLMYAGFGLSAWLAASEALRDRRAKKALEEARQLHLPEARVRELPAEVLQAQRVHELPPGDAHAPGTDEPRPRVGGAVASSANATASTLEALAKLDGEAAASPERTRPASETE
jgi:hypothetical protein